MSFILPFLGCGGGGAASKSITVPPPTGPTQTPFVIAIEVQPSAPSLGLGATQSFTATAIFTDGTTQDVTSSASWASNAASIISMNGATATTGAAGTTYITATSGSVSGHTIVSVGAIPSGGAATYYVATNGLDTNPGTQTAPFLTLDHARQVVAGKAGSVVEIEDGTYYLPATVQFTASDSGSATNPIVYRAAAGAHPIISAGTKITGWIQSGTTNTWTVSLPSASACPVAVPGTFCNFEGLYYQVAGSTDMERRFRPRTTPNTACTVYPCSSYRYSASTNPVLSSSSSTNCSLSVTGGFECFNEFQFNGSDIASTYHDIGLGDVEVLDFEKWTMSRLRLLSVSGNTATLTSPAFQGHDYGFLAGHRYLIENCDPNVGGDPTCQQQVPGQWYLDRCPNTTLACSAPNGQASWTLTYYAQSGETPSSDTVIVPQLLQLMVGNGASNIVFQGLTFSNDNWLPGNPPVSGLSCTGPCGLGDFEGSPYVSAAVSFANAQNVIFNSCTFSHTQGWGVDFVGASTGNEVVNSTLYDIGDGGIRIGVFPTSGDSDSTIPHYNLVENNILDALGRVQPSGIGTGVWLGNAHHNVIAHNQIQDLYSGAVALGELSLINTSPIAHDNILSFNQLFNLGQGVTSDMGGFHVGASGPNSPGNLILNNVIHDVNHNYLDPDGYGGNGLYFDNSSSQSVAHNNLVYHLTWFGVSNNLGGGTSPLTVQNNVVLNNIIALPQKTVIQRGGDIPFSLAFVHNVVYYDFTGPVVGGHWSCPNPTCANQFLLDHNDYWSTLPGNPPPQFVTTTTGSTSVLSLSTWQSLGEDMDSIVANPMFVDPASDNYSLPSSSPAFASPVNFKNFDATQAGVFSASQPTFQTPTAPPTITDCQNLAAGASPPQGACPAFPLELFTSY